MADVPFMDEERGAEEARQRALWAARGLPLKPIQDEEVTPQQVADRRFAESPFGWIDKKLKGAEDWVKGRVAKRQEPFKEMIAKGEPGASHLGLPDPVELGAMMGVGGLRTANRWLYGTKDPSQLRDEDLLGPLGMSAMGAPFAAAKHGISLGSAGGKLVSQAAPFARKVDDLGYYSKLDEVLGTLKPTDTVTMDTLAKRGVKAAEIEARGLSPFIADGKGAKVGDLQKGAQPVQLKESTYRGSKSDRLNDRTGPAKWDKYATDGDNPSYHEGVLHLPMQETRIQMGETSPFAGEGRAMYEGRHLVEGVQDTPFQIGNQSGRITHWPQTFDWKGNPQPGAYVVNAPNMQNARFKSIEEARAAIEKAYASSSDYMGKGRDDVFRSGHWEEPNAIAHYRASMQPTEGGGKAYLIDELQSDWGQKLRDGGVRDEAKIGELKTRLADAEKAYDVAFDKLPKDATLSQTMALPEARQVELLRAELRTAEAATPGNPFVNTSEQWMTTALRRMMRNAAEQQADGIAITPGAIHNERFGLEKHVSDIDVNPVAYEGVDGARQVVLNNRSGVVASGYVGPDGKIIKGYDAFRGGEGKTLADYIGKEMADKIMSQQGQQRLSGQDLRIGGEGMKYAYDKILPKLLSKELSRLDPSIKYGQTKLLEHGTTLEHPTFLGMGDDISPFHHFPLTPKAREEIMKGLPLFNAPGGPEAIAEALRAQQQLQSPFTQDE